jgi:hypothetical protein
MRSAPYAHSSRIGLLIFVSACTSIIEPHESHFSQQDLDEIASEDRYPVVRAATRVPAYLEPDPQPYPLRSESSPTTRGELVFNDGVPSYYPSFFQTKLLQTMPPLPSRLPSRVNQLKAINKTVRYVKTDKGFVVRDKGRLTVIDLKSQIAYPTQETASLQIAFTTAKEVPFPDLVEALESEATFAIDERLSNNPMDPTPELKFETLFVDLRRRFEDVQPEPASRMPAYETSEFVGRTTEHR